VHTLDGFTGWETPYTTVFAGGAGAVLLDVQQARSGKGYFKYFRTGTSGRQLNGPSFQGWTTLGNATNPNLAMPSGALGYLRGRFYVRARTLPTTGAIRLLGLQVGAGGGRTTACGVGLDSAGTFRAYAFSFAGSTHEGALGSAVLPTDTDDWTQIDLTIAIHNSASNNQGSAWVRATITLPDATVETVAHSVSGINLVTTLGTTFTFDECRIFGALGFSYSGSSFETPGAYEVDADDAVIRIATDITSGATLLGIGTVSPQGVIAGVLNDLYVVVSATSTDIYTCSGTGTDWGLTTSLAVPAADRVAYCAPTGAGALAEWTGDHTRALKNVFNTGAGITSQTAGSAGLDTSFAHEALAEIARGATVAAGVHLYMQGTSAASIAFQRFLLGAAVLDGLGDSQTAINQAALPDAMSHACDLTARTPSAFAGLEWGVRSMHATDNTLYGVVAEVLHDGAAHSARESGSDGLQVQWVTWTGDGGDRQARTDVGFFAHLIMVWPLVTAATGAPIVKTIDMPGAMCLAGGTEQGDSIERVTSTGLVAGKHLNVSGVQYVALCVRDDGNADGGRVFGSGAVLGARAHTFAFDAAFAPAIAYVNRFGSAAAVAFWKTSSVPSTTSFQNSVHSSTGITALAANGLTVGTAAAAESTMTTWWGFRLPVQVADRIAQGAVTGQAADAVVSPGAAPYAVFARGSGTGALVTAARFDEAVFSGADCTDWDGGAVNVPNALTAIGALTFTIKGNSSYLDDSPAIDAYWFAFSEAFTVYPPPVAVDDAYDAAFGQLLTVNAAAGVLANDSAEGAGALTAVLSPENDVEHGTLVLAADGSFTYQPGGNFIGDDTFGYMAVNSDGAESNLATVTITVAEPIPAIATEQPQLFARIVVGGTNYMLAETPLADAPGWHSGYKAPRLLGVSTIRRELARDGYRAQTWTLEIADVDRQWRGLSSTNTIEGAYVALYLVFDPVRRAEGTAHRLAAGYVSAHRALGGFRYELTIEDVLGRRLAEYNAHPVVPVKRLSALEFPGLDPSKEGTCAQIAYGVLSDEDEDTPQGVVPATFLGTFNLLTIGGIDWVVDAYILTSHACTDILNLYYNLPDTPDLRSVVPVEAYGTIVVCPFKPEWSAATNLATNFVDYNGQRYTPIFVDSAHELAEAARDGRIQITANLEGVETVGDSTGTLILSPEEILQHILTNYFDRRDSAVADWLADPGLDDVTRLDAASVAAAKAVADARGGYTAGFLIGADGQPELLFDLMQKILEGSDLEMGANRHGQLIVSREDVTAAATRTFDAFDLSDVDTNIDREIRCNLIEYVFARRYVAPSAPRATPAVGAPIPIAPVSPYADWASGLQTVPPIASPSAAQIKVGRIITRRIENYVTRDSATAASVAVAALLRGIGPYPAEDGPRTVRIATNWRGLIQGNTVDVDLGTVVEVQHPEGLTALGWTAVEPARVRVRAIEMDPQAGTVTLEGRVLEEEDEVDMLTVELGGSKHVALNDPDAGAGTYEVVDVAPDFICPNRSAEFLATAKIVVDCRSLAAGTSITPQLRNVTAGTNVSPTAQACSASAADYSGANQRQTIPVTLVAGQQYRLRGVVALNSGDLAETFLQGRLEIGT
jgi:hypothetical protein